MSLSYEDYRNVASEKEACMDKKLPEVINELFIVCDNGRFALYINGEDFYEKINAGEDFSILILNDKAEAL